MGTKNNDGAMAVAEPTGIVTATADDFGGGFSVAGRNETGSNLSRVAMYNGTADEEARYGQHPRGIFLDVLENRPLGMKINVMPVVANARYAEWVKGEKAPVRRWNSQGDVPPELLEWRDDPSGGKNRIPPVVSESIDVLCVVQSVDDKGNAETQPFPYSFVFKSTGLRAFEQTIKPLEARRGMMRKVPGLYQLSSVDDKNAANQPFKRLTARPVGEPTPEMVEIGKVLFKAAKTLAAKSAEIETGGDEGFDPDAPRR